MNLVLLEPDEVTATGRVMLDGIRARHLLTVLDAAVGDTVRLGIIDGPAGVGTVMERGATTIGLQCAFEGIPPCPAIDLLLAVPRPKVLRRLWAQLAALGVRRIVLTNAARVERNYFDTHVLTPECYRPLLLEGLQQARDTRLPLVTVHRQFRVLIEDDLSTLTGNGTRIVADPSGRMTIRESLAADRENRVVLAVGPEGGWNAFELSLLEAHGFQCVGIGGRTLRTDTACVALLALVNDSRTR